MAELVRKYSIADGGGNRETVNDRLVMLVSKGILDRMQEKTGWGLKMSPEKRREVYEFLMSRIDAPIAICKETRILAASLGFSDSMKCNCVD